MKNSMDQSIWGLSNTLTDNFAELTAPDYKTQEIRELMRKFERSLHPMSTKIRSLLSEVVAFRAATSPDFIIERKESIQPSTIVDTFNKMAKAIENAENECSESKESDEFKIFAKAIEYALENIKERLNTIKQNDKFLMEIYTNNSNELKTLFEKKSVRFVL